MRNYTWSLFYSDLSAGIMVAILLVPQAIAYAYLAGMPPEYGLYAALVPILIYALLGTSPHVAIGPVAISAILIFAGVSQLAIPFTPKYIELAIFAGLLIGVIQAMIGFLKKGNLINLLSYPVITGFTSAASLIIISSQLKYILGIKTDQFVSLWSSLKFLVLHISESHLLTVGIAISSFVFIILSKKINTKIPSRLILVVVGITVSHWFDLDSKGIDIIEFVPSGLPEFNIPTISNHQIIPLLPTVLLVSLIGIIESIGIAKALEHKNDFYEINTNQELIATGLSKIGGAFFSALPSSASYSRSALLHQSKARTSIASIVTVLFVILSLLFLTPYLYYLPKVILAVIIIYAVKDLFEYQLGIYLYKVHKFDLILMLITFLATLFLSLVAGVTIGFITSFFILGKTKKSTINEIITIFSQNYKKDIVVSIDTKMKHKAKLFINNDLHFGNAYYLKDLINKEVVNNHEINTVDIIFKEHCDMDSSALKAMKEVILSILLKDKTYSILNINEKLNTRLKNAHIHLSNIEP